MSSPVKRPLSDAEDARDGGGDEKPAEENPSKRLKIEADVSRIHVYVRVKPVSEEHRETRKTIHVVDNTMLVFDPLDECQEYVYHGKMYREIGKRKSKNKSFVFDGVYGESATNMDMYQAVTKEFVSALLDGFNCTIFAYGATGSGKTHTMLGSADEPGVVFFTANELFNSIDARSENEKLEVSVSYFQIYNEVIMDLLAATTGKDLCVRADPKGNFFVSNLSSHHPKNAEHLIQMLEYGNTNRTKQATDANENSSRSHAILQLTIKRKDFSSAQQMCIQLSKMCLIDLAGSERASVAYRQNRDKRLQREGTNINKSLLALGNCIKALSNNQKCTFRDSKLTQLLKDSLGGNCQTAMIATVNPAWPAYEETHNTLSYAESTRGIQLNLKRQSFAVGLQPRNYALALDSLERRNAELTQEIQILREENSKLQKQHNSPPNDPLVHLKSSSDVLNSFKGSLDELFLKQLDLRRQLLESESNLKKIDLKLVMRKLDTERLKQLSALEEPNEPVRQDQLRGLYSQKMHYTATKEELVSKLAEVERKLEEMEKTVRSRVDSTDCITDMYFEYHHLNVESKSKELVMKHASEVADELLTRFESNEEVILESMKLMHHLELTLTGMNRFSDELMAQFSALRRKVEGKKNVVWSDDAAEKGKHGFLKDFNISDVFTLLAYNSPAKECLRQPSELAVVCSGLTPPPPPPACWPEPRVNLTVTKNVAKVQPLQQKNVGSLNDTFSINQPVVRSLATGPRNGWRQLYSSHQSANGFPNRNRSRFRAGWRNNNTNDNRWTNDYLNQNRAFGSVRPSSPFVNNARFRF